MHIAAMAPSFVHQEEIPQEVRDKERAVLETKSIRRG